MTQSYFKSKYNHNDMLNVIMKVFLYDLKLLCFQSIVIEHIKIANTIHMKPVNLYIKKSQAELSTPRHFRMGNNYPPLSINVLTFLFSYYE